MNRDALIVGINQYPFLKDTPTSKAKHLNTPASDAEAIALRLKEYGGFRVRRLPESIQEEQRQVDPKKPLQCQALEEAIIRLFNPVGDSIPQTALLYFAGHGFRQNLGGVTTGFLATSDSDPRKNQWGVSLRWLRDLLQISLVPEQIVWLDCCYSGELFNFTEADLGTGGQNRTRFLIAAAREFEVAEGDIQGEHGVFSQALWQGLDPSKQPDGVVNNDKLIEYIARSLKDVPQQPIWYNPNREIILTGEREEVFIATPSDVCPYKGLRFFDVEDAAYFYGREALTQKLIEGVQVGKGNFLAVLGVSGSGKSSLLQAGLIYQLQQERRLPGTEEWKIRIFTPGEQPLVSLATAFLDEEVTDIERGRQLKEAEEAIKEGAIGLARLIRASKSPRTVLIVDQFEEVFTVCQNQIERQEFIGSLLDALKQTGDKLCLILAMRDDFLGKCAAYRELADLIEANLVMVTPMNAQELRLAIVEPATKLGRKIEENLIDAILKDLGVEAQQQTREPEPGMLPLLSYTLEQLWQRQTLNWLKLDSYNQLGGVQKTLENLAEQAYKKLSVEQQRVADQIFIKLTQLGEGTPDTRKQVPQKDLVTAAESADLVERVIQKLAEAKLIVTSEQRKGKEKVAVVDVAHEALIRHWSRLRELLDNNREAIRTERKIQTAAEEWRDKEKSKDYLLTGLRLGEAEKFVQDDADIVPLSGLAREFIEESGKERDLIQSERDRQRRRTIIGLTSFSVVAFGLAFTAGMGWWRALTGEKNSQLIAGKESSEALFASDKQFDALLKSIRTAQQMKKELGGINANTQMQVITNLMQSVYGVKEQNRFEGYDRPFIRASFSSDGKKIAATTMDDTIKIWNLTGEEITTIEPKRSSHIENVSFNTGDCPVNSVSFSSSSNTIAASDSENIKLWDFQGRELKKFPGKGKDVALTSISNDGQLIAAVSELGKIKIWNQKGEELSNFQHSEIFLPTSRPIFSHDNNVIASADGEETVILLTLKTKTSTPLKNDSVVCSVDFNSKSSELAVTEYLSRVKLWDIKEKKTTFFEDTGVISVIHSPEGLVSTHWDGTLKFWHRFNGQWQVKSSWKGHSAPVWNASFSPDKKMLVSVSDDKTVKLWNLEGLKQLSFRPSNEGLRDISISHDGQAIATVTADGSIQLWTLNATLRREPFQIVSGFRQITFSPDDRYLVSSSDNLVQLWDMQSGESKTLIEQKFSPRGKRNDFGRASFSPDLKTIAIGKEDGTIKLLRLDGTEIQTLQGGSKLVSYSPNGKMIASASSDNKVKLWSADGQELLSLEGSSYSITSLSFSPDSKTLVAGNQNGNIIIWSVAGKRLYTLQGHTSAVSSLTFRADSNIFASASGNGSNKDDGTIKFWSVDGIEIKTFKTDSPSVSGINFSPDGKMLVWANQTEVIMWNLDLNYLLSKGCDWVRDYLQHNPNVSESDRHLCDDIGTTN